jgi:Xaa-Pro aminopeptidase
VSIQRVERLRQLLQQHELEALFVTGAVNRRYMSGFTGSSGYLLITLQDAILFTDFRYREQAPQQAKDYRVIEHQADAALTIAETLKELGVTRLGFEQHHVSFAEYQSYQSKLGVELVPADKLIEQLRMVKDEQEVQLIEAACELVDRTYEHMLGFIKPGMTERDVALELEFFMRASGADSPSFTTIVASGYRSSLPHGAASDKVLEKGDFVTMDFGAYMNGYCSDITRTIILGEPTDRHREIYDIVLEAQLLALDKIKPGMTGQEADAIARDFITSRGYGDLFGHGLGHGLGMEVHEEPRLSKTGKFVLEPGMIVTVEPGIYIPGFGGVRIEDDVVVTETGVRRLTKSSKQLEVLN